MNYKLLIIKLAILSLLILGASAILFSLEQVPFSITSFFPFVVLYFFLLSAVQYRRIGKIRNADIRSFHTKYTAWFGIKLFVNIFVIVLFVLINKAEAKSFLIYFIALYIIYTIFDTYHLSKMVRK